MGPMQLPTYEEEFARDEISPWYTLQHLKVEKRFTNKISAYIGVRNLFNFGSRKSSRRTRIWK